MAGLPGRRLVHSVTIEPLLGNTSAGPKYGPPVQVRCYQRDHHTLERPRAEGSDIRSDTTVYMPLDTDCPIGSRVTLVGGRVGVVLETRRRDAGVRTSRHLEVTVR